MHRKTVKATKVSHIKKAKGRKGRSKGRGKSTAIKA